MTLLGKQKQIRKQLDTDGIDYQVEILIANLIREGYDYDNIDIKQVSYFKRGYKKDIEQVKYDEKNKALIFDITRNALYDTLPEALFHEENAYEDLTHNKDDKNWIAKKHKKRDIEEEQARLFFYPIEKEFFRQRIDIELKERFYYTNFEKDLPTLKNVVERIWGIHEDLTAKQYFALFKWLPLVCDIVGNRKKTEECLSDILENSIKIDVKAASIAEMEGKDSPFLEVGKECVLGVDTVIGNQVNDGTLRWVLTIGPLNKTTVVDYLPDHTKFNLLKIIEKIFIPVEVEFETNLTFERKVTSTDTSGICFELSDDTNSILGYTTLL